MFHIIDDEAMLREVTSAMLMDYGYDVLCFESGEQYLEYLNSPNFTEPTAVLSDVTMPGINGYDLVLEIRKILPFQKIILITGNPDSEHHKKAAQQICFTLNKPFNPEKFIAMVESVSSCHQLHQTDQQQPYPQKCRIDPLFNCPFACHD
jgi:DNA-binding NtrC family response regulator